MMRTTDVNDDDVVPPRRDWGRTATCRNCGDLLGHGDNAAVRVCGACEAAPPLERFVDNAERKRRQREREAPQQRQGPAALLLALIGETPEWQTRAACRGLDPDLFFTERGEPTNDVKKVCAGCAVREECLLYAIGNGEKFGTWGGRSERERRRMRGQLTGVVG